MKPVAGRAARHIGCATFVPTIRIKVRVMNLIVLDDQVCHVKVRAERSGHDAASVVAGEPWLIGIRPSKLGNVVLLDDDMMCGLGQHDSDVAYPLDVQAA